MEEQIGGGALPGGPSVQQGGRMACGLGPLSMLSALTTLFRPLVRAPVSAYLEAMRCIDAAGVIPDVLEFAEITLDTAEDQKQFGALRGDPLPADGIAFLMTYSAEATHPPLYKDMNDKCYDSDRSKITPYGPFIVATVRYMAQLEPYQNDTVFRGVKADLRSDYPKGRKVTWHGFASTTKNMEVLSNKAFCGTGGKRTIFAIKLTQGQAREITRYSLVPSEDEVLLPPGCRFVVESVLPQGDLSLIQLRELPSKEWIVDLNAPRAAVAGEAGSGIATTQSSAAATAYQNQSQRMAQLQCNSADPIDQGQSPATQSSPSAATLPDGLKVGDKVVATKGWSHSIGSYSAGEVGTVVGPCSDFSADRADERVCVDYAGFKGVNQIVGDHCRKAT